ncbi:MAG: hypothetical protein H6828_13395 [Planctomycetes bacterium]|nr:hypothetical protein [Planctomycetota bacterium]
MRRPRLRWLALLPPAQASDDEVRELLEQQGLARPAQVSEQRRCAAATAEVTA